MGHKKFVDPQAEFLFVPANQVEARAKELGATPYDIEGCELGQLREDQTDDMCGMKLAELAEACGMGNYSRAGLAIQRYQTRVLHDQNEQQKLKRVYQLLNVAM